MPKRKKLIYIFKAEEEKYFFTWTQKINNSAWVLLETKKENKNTTMLQMLGTELSLSSRRRMTLGVGEIFLFISHTLPQWHTLVGDTYL
jgi:hypothetical protein